MSAAEMSNPKGIIGICGSGLIGRGWAMLFASAGYQVNLYDLKEQQVSSAIAEIKNHLEMLEEKSALRGSLSAKEHLSLIKGVTSLEECLDGAKHIQECIPERVDLKKEFFEKLDKLVKQNVVLASSTSSISPSSFTENLIHRENCLVNHPINPPYHIRLIEIIPAPWTSQEVLKRTRNLMEEIGQAPVTFAREIPGFGLNRIQMIIMNECWHLVQTGILSASDVDTLMTEGLAPRYVWQGPLETSHLLADGIGMTIEHFGPSFLAMSSTFQPTPSWSPEDSKSLITQMNEAIPLDQLQTRRRWRDERLVALGKLRMQMKESGDKS